MFAACAGVANTGVDEGRRLPTDAGRAASDQSGATRVWRGRSGAGLSGFDFRVGVTGRSTTGACGGADDAGNDASRKELAASGAGGIDTSARASGVTRLRSNCDGTAGCVGAAGEAVSAATPADGVARCRGGDASCSPAGMIGR